MAELYLKRNLITPVTMRIRIVVPYRMSHFKTITTIKTTLKLLLL